MTYLMIERYFVSFRHSVGIKMNANLLAKTNSYILDKLYICIAPYTIKTDIPNNK